MAPDSGRNEKEHRAETRAVIAIRIHQQTYRRHAGGGGGGEGGRKGRREETLEPMIVALVVDACRPLLLRPPSLPAGIPAPRLA